MIECLGGGLGETHRAWDEKLDCEVVVKRIRLDEVLAGESLSKDSEAQRKSLVKAFEREIEILKGLREKPGIINLYDGGFFTDQVTGHEMPYYVMHSVRGKTLDDYVKAHMLDVGQRLKLLGQACRAVEGLHKERLVHGDIKPANLLVDDEGRVLVIDLGLARVFAPWEPSLLAGTPGYLAPEQVSHDFGEISFTTDVYAFGVIAYELLTEQSPLELPNFTQEPEAFCRVLCEDLPLQLGGHHTAYKDTSMERIVARALAKQPRERCELAVLRAEVENFEPKQVIVPRSFALTRNPYRGLQSFREGDSDHFFGRNRLIAKLSDQIRQEPFVPIVGASGSGKSSVVFAGVVPRLRKEETWLIGSMRPKDGLVETLATRLELMADEQSVSQATEHGKQSIVQLVTTLGERYPAKHLVFIVDQFEELYTLDYTSREQERFLSALIEAVGTQPRPPYFTLVITLRVDFLEHRSRDVLFQQLLEADHKIFRAMNPNELREAIEKPAEREGVSLADGLTERILSDMGRSAGGLPLLEFALTRLWEKEQEAPCGALSHDAYDEIGGIGGALKRYAGGVFDSLDSGKKARMRSVLLQLVGMHEAHRAVRRTVNLKELDEADWAMVRLLASHRLVVIQQKKYHLSGDKAEDSAELVHEALIDEWAPLKRWIGVEHEFLVWREGMRQSMKGWHQTRENEALLRGSHLIQAETNLSEHRDKLTEEERRYIKESLRKKKRRRQYVLIFLIVGVLFLTAIAGIGFRLRDKAEQERDKAEQERGKVLVGQSLYLANHSRQQIDAGNIELGILLALEALPKDLNNPNRPYVPEAEAALYKAMLYPERPLKIATLRHYRSINHAAFSPDGKLVASASADAIAKLWDTDSGEAKVTLVGHKAAITYVTFSPDGMRVVTSSADGTARVWDAKSGKPLLILKGHQGPVRHVEYSFDGKQIVTGSADVTARIWNAYNGEFIKELRVGEAVFKNEVNYVAFSPNGGRIITGGMPTILWDAKTWQKIKTIEAGVTTHAKFGMKLAPFSPSGALFATIEGKHIRVRKSNDGSPISWHSRGGHTGFVNSIDFDPLGHRIVTASDDDGTVRIWGMQPDETIRVLPVGLTASANFSPDGRWLVTVGSAGLGVRLWDVQAGRVLFEVGKNRTPSGAMFSRNGQLLITVDGNEADLWKIPGSSIPVVINEEEDIQDFALSRNSDRILTLTNSNRARLWRLSDGSPIAYLEGHNEAIQHAAFNRDGRRIVTASKDNTARIWDSNGTTSRVLVGHQDDVERAAFSKDGRRVVTVSSDGTARVWDEDGKEIAKPLEWTGAFLDEILTPAGLKVLTRIDEEIAQVWDENGVVATIQGNEGLPITGWFSPDGKYVVTNSSEKVLDSLSGNMTFEALLWDAETGKKVRSLGGHPRGGVMLAHFSPDGDWVITGSPEELRVWSVPDGKLQSRLLSSCSKGLLGSLVHINLTRDQRRVIAVKAVGQIEVWDRAKGTSLTSFSAFPATGDCIKKFGGSSDYMDPLVERAKTTHDGQKLAILDSHANSPVRVFDLFKDTFTITDRARRRVTRQLTNQERKAYFLDENPPKPKHDGQIQRPDKEGKKATERLRKRVNSGEIKLVKPTVESIVPYLDSDNPFIRVKAAVVLGDLRDNTAIAPLVEHVEDIDYAVRSAALQALVEIGDKSAVEKVVKLLESDIAEVRQDVANQLRRFGDTTAVAPLIERLGDKNGLVRQYAVEALAELGDEAAVMPLIESLGDEEPSVALSAAEALGKLGDKRAIIPLVARLGHRSGGAAGALVELKDASSISLLIKQLDNDDAKVRRRAAWALGKLRDNSAIGPLIERLGDTVPDVRKVATTALSELGAKRAIPSLIKLLSDNESVVVNAAVAALEQDGSHIAVSGLAMNFGHAPWPIARALVKNRAKAVTGKLVQRLNAEDAETRKAACWALGELGDKSVVDALRDLLDDKHKEVQDGAAKALRKLGDVSAVVPFLIRELQKVDGLTFEWNDEEIALSEIGGAETISGLIGLLEHDKKNIRGSAARVLGELKDPSAVPNLVGRLQDEVDFVRREAAKALGQIGDKAAFEPLFESLKDSPKVRLAVINALGKLGDNRATPVLIEFLEKKSTLRSATEALGRLADRAAFKPLIETFKTTRDLGHTVRVVSQVTDNTTIPYLINLLEADSEQTRQGAAMLLGQLGAKQAVVPLTKRLNVSTINLRA